MNRSKLKIYTKKGSYLNPYVDSYIDLVFKSDVGKDAAGYAVTDASGIITDVVVTNGGWGYDNNTSIELEYSLNTSGNIQLSPTDVSIQYIDVSIFNPDPQNSLSVGSVDIDISTQFIFPSTTYSGALFLDPVAEGLVETEHLALFEESSTGKLIRPFDASNNTLVFRMVGLEKEIKLFTLDDDNQTVEWLETLEVDISTYVEDQPLMLNIGFKAEDEGVFERRLYINQKVNGVEIPIYEIVINAQSIGEDERFNTLSENFGLPKPKEISKLFKEVDINEDLPDWEILNYKGKHLVLEHANIFPYIGSYKALINSIKWLGYEDIEVKEWFKNVKEDKKISLYVPYDAEERKKTILYFSPEERRHLKKLNELSLVYCITRETGEIDEWGNPLIEECYEYNLDEILVKLFSLKTWLENNIIGVNARITDLTGEGIYFERYRNTIYSTQNLTSDARYSQSMTPYALDENSELVQGEASMGFSLREIDETKIEDLRYNKIKDFIDYYWDTSTMDAVQDASIDSDSSLYIPIGSTFQFPFVDLNDIQWNASLEKPTSGVIPERYVTNPLFIYDNEIRFYDILETQTLFFDVSANIDITVEKAYLRDPSIDIWKDSLAYTIYRDPSVSTNWIVESSLGTIVSETFGMLSLQPDTDASLIYEFDDNYGVPLLWFRNYKYTDASGNTNSFSDKYFLDMVDGKIKMEGDGEDYFINFNYDTSLDEQKITLNVVYSSGRIPLVVYDPSVYWFYDASGVDPYPSRVTDNSTYVFDVNHIGNYNVEVFGWNDHNNLFYNPLRDQYLVWTKYPTIEAYTDSSCVSVSDVCSSTEMDASEAMALSLADPKPIFDWDVPLQGLTLEVDASGQYYLEVPSVSFFVDTPQNNSIGRFYNLSERVVSIDGSLLTVDEDYQSFLTDDSINVVLWSREEKDVILQKESVIIDASESGDRNVLEVPGIDSSFYIGSSTAMYVQNTTEREVTNRYNDASDNFVCDISNYIFRENQLVLLLVESSTLMDTWGASYRVIDVSGNTHTFSDTFPQVFLDDPSEYTITAKHAFTTFADHYIDVSTASEVNNNFLMYMDDTYFQQYYLDSTFVFVNVLFDEDDVKLQWYDPTSDPSLNDQYMFKERISVDPSTLVILRATYDPSNYMLDQKNIWTVTDEDDNIVLRVFNDTVLYVFNETGKYDVRVEAYDSWGNLRQQDFEGLINVT